MSSLLLIRHGQARAFEADSDRLSPLGETQARHLGQYLANRGIAPDEVLTGTLERQRRTWAIAAEAMLAAGTTVPDVVEDAGWNEYDASAILGRLLPALAARDDGFRALVQAFHEEMNGPERNRHFQRMFEALMDRWRLGEAAEEGVESFETFHGRVTRALAAITERGGNRTVAVFTSGGPIGVCVQTVMGAPPAAALRLNSRVKNGSVTEFVFSRGRISLDCFNSTHFYPDDLLSFR